MKTFKHMGKIGDIIFSLPTIRELGGGILYIPENTPDGCFGMYTALKDLLLLQPYINEVREYPSGLAYKEQAPGIAIDYDLDLARDQPLKGRIHIVKRYMDAFGVEYVGWKEPWLVLPDDKPLIEGEYVVINYTSRHITNDQLRITSNVNWKNVLNSIKEKAFFIGTKDEYSNFINANGYVEHFTTANMLEVAKVIKNAKSIYCNQSSVLALSQSLSKPYFLDVKPHKTNTLLYTSNEHLLQ